MGAVGYMLKPVERAQIKAALRKLEAKFSSTARRLLVVEDDAPQRDAICQLLGGEGVEIIAVGTVREALEQLRSTPLDCVVTDLALPDGSGHDLLRAMATDEAYSSPSVVVYTGRSLSPEEEQRLRMYSHAIIVKGARSPERLLDEVTLFLHQVESKLPPERQRMLKKARSREAIFEGRSVLVVEDDVRNVFALTSALEPKGMKVSIARNGREALAVLDRTDDRARAHGHHDARDGRPGSDSRHSQPAQVGEASNHRLDGEGHEGRSGTLHSSRRQRIHPQAARYRHAALALAYMDPQVTPRVQHESVAEEDIELELLLRAIFLKFHYDFRHYARSSLKRRLGSALLAFDCRNLSACRNACFMTTEYSRSCCGF